MMSQSVRGRASKEERDRKALAALTSSQVEVLRELQASVRSIVESCLTCHRKLTTDEVKKLEVRCRKCDRKYQIVWPKDRHEFHELFQGQI